MLYRYYPPIHKPVEQPFKTIGYAPNEVTSYNIGDITRAKELGITTEEFTRRCKIVRDAWIKCHLFLGETVYPVNQKDYEENGAMRVINLVKDYRDMLDTEWPANDNPFIVALIPITGIPPFSTTYATNGWAVKDNKHLKVVAHSAPEC